ncbi:MAG: DUF2442 domain-containing protein [Balneolaceae bacterium]
MDRIISKPKRPFVVDVKAQGHSTVYLRFENGEERILDLKPWFTGVFEELKDPDYFRKVRVADGSIAWPNGQDLAYDMLYYKSSSLTAVR